LGYRKVYRKLHQYYNTAEESGLACRPAPVGC